MKRRVQFEKSDGNVRDGVAPHRIPDPGKQPRTRTLGAVQRKSLAGDMPAPARPSAGAAEASRDNTETGFLWALGFPPVQEEGELAGEHVHETAARGVSGSGTAVPHAEAISRSFGQHDVSGVTAHIGGEAAAACDAMGASAYATGTQLAFKRSPDLHTAAHEAAHVVQQRAGVQLKGGIGQAGDRYERHADAVANLVVQGKSAEGLLDEMAGTGESARSAVQRMNEGGTSTRAAVVQLSTDMNALATTVADERFQEAGEKKTVKEIIDAKDESKGGVERDANYSNVRKRHFEEALARLLFLNRSAIWEPVKKVSANIVRYLDARADLQIAPIEESFNMLAARNDALGSAGFDHTDVSAARKVLLDETPESLPTHLNAHNKFSFNIYLSDYASGKAQDIAKKATNRAYDAVAEMAGVAGEKPDGYQPGRILLPDDLFEVREGSNTGRPRKSKPAEDRPEPALKMSGLEPDSTKNDLLPETFIDGRPTHSRQKHTRGIDFLLIDELKTWAQEARIVLDMPLAAGPSGSAGYDLISAIEMGLGSGEERKQYVMAMVASMIGGGHHTFHEIMTVAAIAGIPYTAGRYDSDVYPESVKSLPAFEELKSQYSEFFP